MDSNPDHAGLKAACVELDRLFADSRRAVSAASDDPLHQHFSRLALHGVTPVDVLAMYAAVALYDREHERDLKDAAQYRYAVARAICGVVPRQGVVLRARCLDRIGRYIVERYSGLVGGVVTVIEKTEHAQRQRSAAMSAPFTSP